jgi:short-subunit dehydrogenase
VARRCKLLPVSVERLGERYGPWALIAGASDGVGASVARRLANAGISVVLVARRTEILEALAEEIRADHGVQARVLPTDLAVAGAASRIAEAIADLEIGLFVANAGSDDHGKDFLDVPGEEWLGLVQRNVVTTLDLCHRVGAPMRSRGRGGMVLVSSGAGRAGAGRIAVYAATKAFDRTLAEGLWWEFGRYGVDVLSIVLRGTATPSLLRTLDRHGLTVPGLDEPDDVARIALERLPHGPTYCMGEDTGAVDAIWSVEARRDMVRSGSASAEQFFGAEDGRRT